MIDREQVQKVALLARLALDDAEIDMFTTQLNDILGYFEQLGELDTTDVEPTTRAIEVVNITRHDQRVSMSDREEILQGAPDRDGDFFKVPKIINE